jgi:hypothetical protein
MPSVVVVDGNADLRFLISPLLRLDGTLLSRAGQARAEADPSDPTV